MAIKKKFLNEGRLTTVELFCGIGGFRLACDSLDIPTIWANDSKSTACAVYRDRFGPSELIEGDLLENLESIPNHVLLTAGFPCQPFSQAGKKKGIRDPRGTLFNAIVQILKHKRPQYFVLENVKRLISMEDGEHFATILSALSELDYLIEWRLLNAMYFGIPQNRQRTFIVGRKVESGVISTSTSVVRLLNPNEIDLLPTDLGKLLVDPGRWVSFSAHGRRFPEWGIAFHGRFIAHSVPDFFPKSELVRVRDVLEDNVGSEYDLTKSTRARLKDSAQVNRFVQGVEILSNQGGGARMGYTIFGINGVAPTLTASTSRHYERYLVGKKYRRLTPNEYARIQGFPDGHCKAVNPYTQYELYGNAVPPAMAGWVVEKLISEPQVLPARLPRKAQRDLFVNAGA